MNRLILALVAGLSAGPSIGATVNIYGHIDIGGLPQPPVLVNREPIIVERVRTVREPLYLHVPPGHAKHWSKNCRKYNACNRPVYFVDDEWYDRVYVPERQRRGGHEDRHYDGDRGPGRDQRAYEQDRHDDRHEERGKDHGNGHGNNRGKGR